MKKTTFLLIVGFIVFSLTNVCGQPDIGFGIKAGINLSDQVTTGTGEGVNVKSILRPLGGIYFNYLIFDKLAVQPELLVSGKGSDWDDPYYNVRDLLTYIDIPVMVKYQVIKVVNITAGPQFGYLLKAVQKDNDSGDKENITDYYKKPDFAISIGAEANLPYRINVSLRYVFGLLDTTTDVEYIEPWRNNFFQISAGFRILGK